MSKFIWEKLKNVSTSFFSHEPFEMNLIELVDFSTDSEKALYIPIKYTFQNTKH